jgi:hypothetical protein
MRKKLIWTAVLVLPLAVAGLVYGQTLVQCHSEKRQQAETFICPLTGEELPCPNCCPLNQEK